MTIAEYWESHGFSKEEAKKIEREQIEEQVKFQEEQDLCDAGIWNMY